MRIRLLLPLVLAGGCASPPAEPAPPAPDLLDRDVAARILEERQLPPEDASSVMNGLERLLPSWQSAQRRGRADPIERELVRKVVVNYEAVTGMLESGPHERQLVAAWALGFARVPQNDLGVDSPHLDAVERLLPLLEDSSDDLTSNALLGVWKLAEPTTPLRPLSDLVINHHDADVRANACLAIGAVLTEDRVRQAVEPLLVALGDTEPTVRLHAANIAWHWPQAAFTSQIEGSVAEEDTPLVLAAMVRALGSSGSRSSAPLLVYLLESPREVVAESARLALIDLYGVDKGALRADWSAYLLEIE
jgi:hypothetical protein